MLVGGWPCHTKMAAVDGSMERLETGKGQKERKSSNGSGSMANNSHSDNNEKQLKTCLLINWFCSLEEGMVMAQGYSDFHTQNHQCHTEDR